jgi:predicted TIM-barrel fold metal-dependent hydrolase
MTDGTMDWLWPAAEKAGIPIALMASNYLPLVGQIAERHPGLRLLLDHYARVRGGSDDEAHGNQPALLALAKHKNVAVKCTGAPGNSSHAYPYKNIHKYTQQIVEAFGPERSFWGTDITRMPCSWKQCVTMFTEEMPWLKGRDLEMVMGRAVCDFLGWKL